jgi:hypothetical protein
MPLPTKFKISLPITLPTSINPVSRFASLPPAIRRNCMIKKTISLMSCLPAKEIPRNETIVEKVQS